MLGGESKMDVLEALSADNKKIDEGNGLPFIEGLDVSLP